MSDQIVLSDDVIERAVEALQPLIGGDQDPATKYAATCTLVDVVVDALREGSRAEVHEASIPDEAGREDRASGDASEAQQ